jgi:hypothetical protein
MTAETIDLVIASEAKQSISLREERLDCFVASLLAMTGVDGNASDLRQHP